MSRAIYEYEEVLVRIELGSIPHVYAATAVHETVPNATGRTPPASYVIGYILVRELFNLPVHPVPAVVVIKYNDVIRKKGD